MLKWLPTCWRTLTNLNISVLDYCWAVSRRLYNIFIVTEYLNPNAKFSLSSFCLFLPVSWDDAVVSVADAVAAAVELMQWIEQSKVPLSLPPLLPLTHDWPEQTECLQSVTVCWVAVESGQVQVE